MALDTALLENVHAGAPPVLRFYRWAPACLSLGRNQPACGHYDLERLRARGYDLVRRPTGGRAVLHDRELTYAVVVAERVLGGPRQTYAAINRALVRGLRRLGVAAELQPGSGRRAPVPSLLPCFEEPAEGEVMVGGRKLVGSAQRREQRVILQHGSLLLDDDQAAAGELLREPPASTPEVRPATLAEHLDPLPTWDALTAALRAGWEEEIHLPLFPSAPSSTELDRTAALAAHYSSPAWTWRC